MPRPTTANAIWRHLSIISLETDIGTVGPVTMNAGELENCYRYIDDFSQKIWDYSDQQCLIQQDVYVLSATVDGFGDDGSGHYATDFNQLRPTMLSVGIDPIVYDTISNFVSGRAYNQPASGLSYLVNNSGGYSFCQVLGYPEYVTEELIHLQVHEWLHCAVFWYGSWATPTTPMPNIDDSGSYRHLNNAAWTVGNDGEDFIRSVLTGDCEDSATSTARGMTSAVWAYGTPRGDLPFVE